MSERICFFKPTLLGGLDDNVNEVGKSKVLRSEFVLRVYTIDDVDTQH